MERRLALIALLALGCLLAGCGQKVEYSEPPKENMGERMREKGFSESEIEGRQAMPQ